MEIIAHNLTNLFLQLGMPASDKAIADFVNTHHLPSNRRLPEALWWTPAQAKFLEEGWKEDADWAPVIEELNSMLH